MATASEADIREQLAALGRRRQELDEDTDQLMDEVEKLLKRAYGKVPVAEAARLLGMHRTTIYRVYHPHG